MADSVNHSLNPSEEKEIVIVGGGICGLATALALHRKGIRSIVLERSESLRAYGLTIMIRTNGWYALDHLGVASTLRQSAFPLHLLRDIWLDKGRQTESQVSKGEARCIKRSDLIETLASELPTGTIRFGCRVTSIKLDPFRSLPVLHLQDGSIIKAKILIGCDGVNSVVADFLGLKAVEFSSKSSVRGVTDYAEGHGFPIECVHFYKNRILIGRIPITHTLVYWFITRSWKSQDAELLGNQELIKRSCLESAQGFPTEVVDMINRSELDSLTLARFRHRPPWDLLSLSAYRKGTVTIAGDAMHVMNPFIGQGGASSLEDGIVLARCLAKKLHEINSNVDGKEVKVQKVGEAFDEYLKERRVRLVMLSLQAYLKGRLLEPSLSFLKKYFIILLLYIFFRDPVGHSKYDCGPL